VVTRRRYKARPAVADAPAAPAPAAPVAPAPAPEGQAASPLLGALAAQQHAEHLQRQHAIRGQAGLQEPELDPATRQAVHAHIDTIPGLTDHKRRFLKSHPSLLTEPYVQSMRHAHAMALHAGIPDDTPAMDAAVLAGIHKDVEHHRALSQLTAASARQTPENAQAHDNVHEAAAELAREAEQHLAAHPAPAAPPPTPPRKKMQYSAPVSRNYPETSGRGRQDNRTLTADERQIARASMPHLPPDQAEYQYMINRKRMHEMKSDGRIQGDG
jgi:hypothetical protein